MHALTLVMIWLAPVSSPPADFVIDLQALAMPADPASACAVERLAPFAGPFGIRQAWPIVAAPSLDLLTTMGTPIPHSGLVADGYQHTVHVDPQARTVHIVEQGGFAGTTRVYGPLPLPSCARQQRAAPP